MARIEDIIKIMQEFAPEHFTMPDYQDNVGLLIGDKGLPVQNIYCCLDLTNEDIDKAIAFKAELIICHHPLIYTPIKSITADTILGAKILRLIKHSIAVYCAHTNLDFIKGGLNEYACSLISLKNMRPLDPYISTMEGSGRIGELEKPVALRQLASQVSAIFNDSRVDFVGDPDHQIKTVAMMNGGSGDIKYIELSKKMGADCYICGDVRHHIKVYAKDANFPIIEVSHYHTENIYIPQLAKILTEKAKGFKVNIHF